jgi:hypothetical protein
MVINFCMDACNGIEVNCLKIQIRTSTPLYSNNLRGLRSMHDALRAEIFVEFSKRSDAVEHGRTTH